MNDPVWRRYRLAETTTTEGRIIVEEHGTAAVNAMFPRWERIPTDVQLSLLAEIEPSQRHISTNTTCIGLHEWAVDGLDASQPDTPKATLIAVGTSDTAPQESDRSLNAPVATLDITGFDDNGDNIFLTALAGADEANVNTGQGEALHECGAIAGGLDGSERYFLNHGLFTVPIEKDPTIIATITVQLIFDAQ